MRPCEVALLCALLCLSLCQRSAGWATAVRTQRLFPRANAHSEDPYSSLLDLAKPVDKDLASVLMAEAALGSPALSASFDEVDFRAEGEVKQPQDDSAWERGAGLPKLAASSHEALLEKGLWSKPKKRIEIPAVVKEFILATLFDRSVSDEQVKSETSWRYAAMETRAWLKALRKRKGRHMLPSLKAHFAKVWLSHEPVAAFQSPPSVVMDEQVDFFLPKPKATRLDYLQPKLPSGRAVPGNPVICQLCSLKDWDSPAASSSSAAGHFDDNADLPSKSEGLEAATIIPVQSILPCFHVEESPMPIASYFQGQGGNSASEYYVVL